MKPWKRKKQRNQKEASKQKTKNELRKPKSRPEHLQQSLSSRSFSLLLSFSAPLKLKLKEEHQPAHEYVQVVGHSIAAW